MLASVADLPGIYAAIAAQGAEVVAVRAVNDDGGVAAPPKDLIINPIDIPGSQGFAWIANHQKSGKAWLQVQVRTLRPPFDLQVSGFLEPGAVAGYVTTGKPVGVAAPRPVFTVTETSTFNEATHTTVAVFKK